MVSGMKGGHLRTGKDIWWPKRCINVGQRAGHALLEVICPATCGGCGRRIAYGDEFLCDECWSKLRGNLGGQTCPTCGRDVGAYGLIEGRCHRCQNRRPVVGQVVRVGRYDGVLRELILALKFKGRQSLDGLLGTMLADAIVGAPGLGGADVLVPVPLHWRRRLSRRYNQAELLARRAARRLKEQGRAIPVDRNLLRVRHTRPQTSLAHSHRLRNLHGAFATRAGGWYEGKHICLVDDVTTTGTTLRVAAAALRKAGAAKVSAAVIAVAAND